MKKLFVFLLSFSLLNVCMAQEFFTPDSSIPDVADHFNPFFVQLNIGVIGIGIGQ